MIQKLKEWVFFRGYQFFGRNTFSQAGEDAIINSLLYQAGNLKPSYLELGVFHPWDGSNTYKFYLRGGRGVLVEADASQIATITAARPGDKVLNIGVSFTGESQADFFIFEEKSVSTFSREEAMIRQNNGNKILRTAQVQLKSINQILKENFDTYPDILSIDIEGLDFEVLTQLDSATFPIPIICAETCSYSLTHIKPKDKKIEELLSSKGYFLYADTYLNGIFVHQEWFKNIRK